MANRSFPFNKGKQPISRPSDDLIDTGLENQHRIGQLTQDWSIGTGMVNWNSIGNVGILAIHRGVG